MSATDTLASLSTEIARVLLIIHKHLSPYAEFESFMRKLGWEIESIPPPLQQVKTSADNLLQSLDLVITSSTPGPAAIRSLIVAIRELIQKIDDLRGAQFDPVLEANQIRQVLAQNYID